MSSIRIQRSITTVERVFSRPSLETPRHRQHRIQPYSTIPIFVSTSGSLFGKQRNHIDSPCICSPLHKFIVSLDTSSNRQTQKVHLQVRLHSNDASSGHNHNHHHHHHSNDPKHGKKRECWNCGSNLDSRALFCKTDGCKVIQNVFAATLPTPKSTSELPARNENGAVNYFEVFDVSPRFDVDIGQIKRKFIALQQEIHPDNFGQKSRYEKQLSDAQSTFINRAYQTIRDPLSRSIYLLGMHDVKISESESLKDPELLMEVLEFRERLEEAETEEEVADIQRELQGKLETTLKALQNAFSRKDYTDARERTIELQYWNNISKAIRDRQ